MFLSHRSRGRKGVFYDTTLGCQEHPLEVRVLLSCAHPSTTSGLDGLPYSSKKDRQFVALMVPGRPPAGTKASAFTLLCIVLRARMPSSLSHVWSTPSGSSCSSICPNRPTDRPTNQQINQTRSDVTEVKRPCSLPSKADKENERISFRHVMASVAFRIKTVTLLMGGKIRKKFRFQVLTDGGAGKNGCAWHGRVVPEEEIEGIEYRRSKT